MNPGTALDGIYVLGSKGLRGHMTDGKYNAGAGILPTETPPAWLVVLQPQDYFQYDVNVRMKCLHTQSKPNHDGTRHMLPRSSHTLPRCFPAASQMPSDASGDVSHMPPTCRPDASQLTSARRHKSYHRIASKFYWNFIGNKIPKKLNFLSHDTCIYHCKNRLK